MQTLHLKQFRCFEEKIVQFSHPVTILSGLNGSGKSSILEAIFYLSYFKSFRAYSLSDIMHHQAGSFFVKAIFSASDEFQQRTLQIGYSAKKKIIKLDQQTVKSYKEILNIFSTVALTQHDIELVQGYPSARRSFIDQAVVLHNVANLSIYKQFKMILDNRNALLFRSSWDRVELQIWTEKLWQITAQIAILRMNACAQIEQLVNDSLLQFFDQCFNLSLQYQSKSFAIDFDDFTSKNMQIFEQERVLKRSLFGAHLDDISILLNQKNARIYASAGQQKLIAFLMKLALASIQSKDRILPTLLIDDFISDFDIIKIDQMINFMKNCHNQVIITTPILDQNFEKIIKKLDTGCIEL